MGKQWEQWQTFFFFFGGGRQNHCRWWLQPWNESTLTPWKKSYDQPRQHIKKQRHYCANKSPSGQSYGFSSSHVWMWKLDCKEGWALKNWCFWTVVLEKTLRVPWTARRSNQSTLKEIRSEWSLEELMLKWLNWLLPPLCPQNCSLHLCLYSCPANRFIGTIFPDSIYMH